jgi:hypothetical protein
MFFDRITKFENSAQLSLCSAWLSWSMDIDLVYNWHGRGGNPNFVLHIFSSFVMIKLYSENQLYG